MEILITILVVVLLIVLRIIFPKGRMAEIRVHNVLKKLPDEYRALDNIIIGSNGYSSQIDHVVVSPYGIFVIETKGYKGWIHGGEESEYWTQNIYGKKYQFYNPIRQNKGHVTALLKTLPNVPKDAYIPVVCFNNDATLFVKVHTHIVINRRHLKKTIEQYKTPVLSPDIVSSTVVKLTEFTKTDREVEKEHINNARNRAYINRESIRRGICPRCGGELVERYGSYGSFLGCSNYPRCKFTHNEE